MTAAVIYFDGALVDITFSTPTTKEAWFSVLGSLDRGYIGALQYNNGAILRFYDGTMTPPIYTRKTLTAAEVMGIYTRGQNFINSPTNDVLQEAAVVAVGTEEISGRLVVVGANTAGVRDASGAVLQQFSSLGIGTLACAAIPATPGIDSVSVMIGGSTGIYILQPDPKVVDLALASWPVHSANWIGNGPVRVDSSGVGHAWTVQDGLAMASNVGITEVELIGPATYPDPVTSMLTNRMHLTGSGRPLITNANTVATTPVPAFTTGAFDSLEIRHIDVQTATDAAGGNQEAITVTSGADFGVMEDVRVRDSDVTGINGTNGEWWVYDNCEVLDADATAIALGINSRITGGSFTCATFPLVSYGQSVIGSVFSGANSAWITSAADTSRIIGNSFDCPLTIKADNERSMIIGNRITIGTGHTIEDHGTGTSLTGNIEP